MVSQFEETLRKAREEASAKLRIIAPGYKQPLGNVYGRPRGGGGSSSGSYSRSALIAAQKAAAKVRAAQIVAEAKARQVAADKALALQKAQNEAAAKIADAQAKIELNRIIAIQQNIITNKGQINQKKLIDSKTRNVLEITRYTRNGDFVQRSYNTVTGEIKFHAFGQTRNGGKKSRSSVTIGGKTNLISSKFEGILFSSGKDAYFETRQTGTKGGVPTMQVFFVDKARNINIVVPIEQQKKYKLGGYREQELQASNTLAPASLFKRIVGAFSIKKFRAYREKQRQDYYDLYGLTGKDRNFATLVSSVQTRNLSTSQKNKFTGLVIQDLKQDLLNPDTAIRAEVALIIAAVAGGALVGGAVGAAYKTPISLAKNLGVEESLKDVSWKDVAKKGGVEFGKNAVQSYFALKLFGLGARAASRVPALIGGRLSAAGLKQAGIFTNKALSFALRKGLNVVGAQYLASIGVDVAQLGKKFKSKKYKAATVQAAGLLGVLVGFYGEKTVKRVLRKVMLAEDPRLILTKGTKSKPFAVENRQITLARLNKVKKNLKGERTVKFAKASPVREPFGKKIVTPELRKARGVKIDVPTPAGYATYAVGKEVYIIPNTFLKRRPGNLPKTYYTKWFQNVRKRGFIKTIKELGFPKIYSPRIYKGTGEYLPRNKGESLKDYYARGLRTANRLKKVQVVVAPKTILGSKQPELEIKTIYPNPKGVKSSVTRVVVGKDGFGHKVVVEIVAPKSIIQRFKFRISEKIKFKKEALKYLTNREAKIAKDLAPRIIQNYNLIYKTKAKGSSQARKHMLKVEQNFRRILIHHKIKATDAEIKAVARLHDILKLRGINVKDEPIIRKAILEGYLNEIPLIKKLNFKQRVRVADAIGFHQDVNPRTLKALRLSKFAKAFINADRLDITRYGIKVNPKKLFNLKAKRLIPKNVRKEFARLNRLRMKRKGFTATLRRKYNSMVRKYPGLKGKKFENKIIAENKARYKRMSPKQKARIRKQERGYTDYKESLVKYKRMKRGKKVIIPYRTKRYNSYKSPKYKAAYRAGYSAGYNYRSKAPTNYNTKYGRNQNVYAQGYRDGYKGNYKINYKTGKYIIKIPPYKRPPRPPTKKPPIIPINLKKKFKKRTISKKVPVYYIKIKRKGRIVNLTPRPLRLQEAKDLLVWSVDRNLVRSGWFEPMGKAKKVIGLPPQIRNYYMKNKHKVRPYKIRVGKKRQIRNGFIEKRRFALDSKREKSQIKAAAKRARKRKPIVKKKTRRTKTKKKR